MERRGVRGWTKGTLEGPNPCSSEGLMRHESKPHSWPHGTQAVPMQFGLNLKMHRPMPSTDHNHILPFRFPSPTSPNGCTTPQARPKNKEHPPGLRQGWRRGGVDHGVRQERLGGLGLRQVTEVGQHAADLRHEPHRRPRGSGLSGAREAERSVDALGHGRDRS